MGFFCAQLKERFNTGKTRKKPPIKMEFENELCTNAEHMMIAKMYKLLLRFQKRKGTS